MFVHFQAFNQKLIRPAWQFFTSYNVLNGLTLDFPEQLFLIFGLPRSITEEHLIENNPKRPNVTLEGVLILPKGLRSHIKWGANIIFATFGQGFYLDGKSEISDFDLVIFSD